MIFPIFPLIFLYIKIECLFSKSASLILCKCCNRVQVNTKRRLYAVARGGIAHERRSYEYKREHSHVRTHAVTVLAALVRRLLSAPLGSSRRALLTSLTTRDFVVAVSLSMSTRPLGSVCVCRRTHTRGGGGNQSTGAPAIEEGNTRITILSTHVEVETINRFIAPEAQSNTTTLRVTSGWCARARKSQRRMCAPSHTNRT